MSALEKFCWVYKMKRHKIYRDKIKSIAVLNLHHHLQSIDSDFRAVGIEYAFVGGMALMPHNYIRMTQDIDILVSKETAHNLVKLHGRGYTLRPGATNNMYLHVGDSRVPVDILIEGQNQDGIIMPDPSPIRTRINGVWFVTLVNLIKLKLQANRPQDLQDVAQLIEANRLSSTYVENLPEALHQRFLSLFK